MSSEMRELVKDLLRTEMTQWSHAFARDKEIAQLALTTFCAKLDATLLARTEAGADGAVAWLVRCRRTGRVVWSDPSRSTAEGYARQIAHRMPDNTLDTEVIPLHTHPQDASGDAEVRELRRVLNKLADYWIAITRDKDVAHRDRAIIDAYDKGLTKCAAELRAAMQAKEAK